MDSAFVNKKYILCTVDRIEGHFAVLKTDDGQKLNWPSDKLPHDIIEGSEVKLIILSDKAEEKEREETVKAVLNEILKTE